MMYLMTEQPSFRPILKWTGLLTCLCLTCLWLISIRWLCEYDCNYSKSPVYFMLASGLFVFYQYETMVPQPTFSTPRNCWRTTENPRQTSDVPLTRRLGLQRPLKSRTQLAIVYRLPLWLPILITATPTIAVFWRDLRRAATRRPARTCKLERWGKLPSILLGIGGFVVLLWPADFVVETICLGLWGREFFIIPRNPAPPPTLRFAIPLIVVLAVSYAGARLAYEKARWRWIATSSDYCQSCGYNLTANVSGICPECGQPVPQADSESTIVT
jgi:hypothetical protein